MASTWNVDADYVALLRVVQSEWAEFATAALFDDWVLETVNQDRTEAEGIRAAGGRRRRLALLLWRIDVKTNFGRSALETQ